MSEHKDVSDILEGGLFIPATEEEIYARHSVDTPLVPSLLVKRGEWIPVGERLPEEGIPVLITNGKECYVAEYTESGNWGDLDDYYTSCSFDRNELTHWQPLPEPPEASE